jgi:hypothetical protein
MRFNVYHIDDSGDHKHVCWYEDEHPPPPNATLKLPDGRDLMVIAVEYGCSPSEPLNLTSFTPTLRHVLVTITQSEDD